MKFSKQHIPFTQVANDILNNPEISAKAKGLYSYLYSKPDGWKFSASRIQKDFADGKRSIMSGLQELEDKELLQRTKNADGTMDYHLLYKGLSKVEIEDEPLTQNRIDESKSQSAKTALRVHSQSAVSAKCGNSKVLKPQSAKTAPVSNKDFRPIKSLKKERKGKKDERPPFSSEDSFDLFFNEYGKPVDEEKENEAYQEWIDLSEEDRQAAFEFIEFYKKYEPNPKFRKHPNNYLAKRTWEKERSLIMESLKYQETGQVYYTYQQMTHEVTGHPTLSTDHFERIDHPQTGEKVWVLKDKEVING